MGRPPIILAGPFIDLAFASRREWLETNGLGGFASSTVIGLNTRRYHGLLVAATRPPDGRVMVLSKLEEAVLLNGRRYELSVNRYPGTLHPEGYRWLTEIRLDPLPTFTWEIEGIEIRKRVFMLHGENTTVVEYETNGECTLELRPLIACRGFHALRRKDQPFDGSFRETGPMVVMRPCRELPALWLSHNASQIERTGDWYLNTEYLVERERGFDYQEDLFNPFVARYGIGPRHSAVLIATASSETESAPLHDASQARALRAKELARREAVLAASPCDDPLVLQLVAAADQFVVAGRGRESIIAGYHWYAERRRDTLIALPGLLLVTGRFDAARRIIDAYTAEPPNDTETAFWLVEAVRAYRAYTGDDHFVLDQPPASSMPAPNHGFDELPNPAAVTEPWRVGRMITSYVKAHGRSPEARAQAERCLRSFNEHLLEGGLGHISEFGTNGGAIAMAINTAELLRAAVEDVFNVRPVLNRPSKKESAFVANATNANIKLTAES
jgi:predicted glycogen debranching enzyme